MSPRPWRPRDEQGWRVPREGTLSRAIYDRRGLTRTDIATALGITAAKVGVLIHKMKYAARTNEWCAKYPKPPGYKRDNGGWRNKDSAYVNKLVRVMRIPRHEAREIEKREAGK